MGLKQLVETAERAGAAAVATSRPVFIAFSGGKDSIALAHLFRPWRNRVRLLWVNTGYMAPHMVEFVRGHAREFTLTEITGPPILENWSRCGPPSEVVEPKRSVSLGGDPAAATVAAFRAGTALETGRVVQTLHTCCGANKMAPLLEYVHAASPCVLAHGERLDESNGLAVLPQHTHADDVISIAPLWNWTQADVLTYLSEAGIALPAQYAEWVNSIECLICPAQLSRERLDYLDRHAPEAANFVRETARRTLQSAQEAIERYSALIDRAAG
ncbi:MAG: phosphoadenosine phosphosulfate reductase family protein [Hyphomonadaceae bacterium]|nr:phosphoadenosine phosphosulfate reductase family protein [Hyphomonadaceae bacterium]